MIFHKCRLHESFVAVVKMMNQRIFYHDHNFFCFNPQFSQQSFLFVNFSILLDFSHKNFLKQLKKISLLIFFCDTTVAAERRGENEG